MAANPEMPTPKPSFMYILSNSGLRKRVWNKIIRQGDYDYRSKRF
jgi:hypothetical protein